MRFTSVAFRKSPSDNSLSVVDEACALSKSVTVPAHGRAFYLSLIDDPVIWWTFGDSELPSGFVSAQGDSDTGDKCHYGITNVGDPDLKKMLTSKNLSDFWIETTDGKRPLQDADLP